MKVIDIHTHWGKGEWKAKRRWLEIGIQGLAELEEGISATDVAVFPIGSERKAPGRYNDMGSAILDEIHCYEGPVNFHYFARFDCADENDNTVEQEVGRGAKGIKIEFTPLQSGEWDAEYMEYVADIVRASDGLGIPVLVHTSITPKYHPERVAELMAKAGRGEVILGHSGEKPSRVDIEGLSALPGVYFETSGLTLYQKCILLDRTGGRNVVFGSDCPYGTPKLEMESLYEALRLTGLERTKEDVFYNTSARLLGLS